MTKPVIHERESAWELLRILAMLAIVFSHFYWQSGAKDISSNLFSQTMMSFLGNGASVAVSLFLLLGVWFMTEAKFRGERFIKLCFQYHFYCLIIVAGLFIGGYPLSRQDILAAFLPYLYGPWFVRSYLALILISPWLQHAFRLTRISLFKLILVLFILISGISTVLKGMYNWLDVLAFFMFIYIAVGVYKKYIFHHISRKTIFSICSLSFAVYILLVYLIHEGGSYASGRELFERL